MEVGKYIDFHGSDTDSSDYTTRLEAISTTDLRIGGSKIWTQGNDGSGSGLDADTVDGLHETSFVRTSSGTNSTLDTFYRAGMFNWNTSTTGKPWDSYGQGLAIVSSGSTHNDTNNWITQLGFGTNRNSAYFRCKTNNGTWGSWNTFWHSGNDGSGSGLDADTVYGLQASQFIRSDANDTATGVVTFSDRIQAHEIRTNTGQELILNAGESANVATGQTGEYVYVNAEGGLQINTSPDNWNSGWAGRDTFTINGSCLQFPDGTTQTTAATADEQDYGLITGAVTASNDYGALT